MEKFSGRIAPRCVVSRKGFDGDSLPRGHLPVAQADGSGQMRCRIGIGYDGSRGSQNGSKRLRVQVVVMVVGDEHQRSLGLGGKIAHLAVRIGVDRLPTQAQQQARMTEGMDFQLAHRGLARTFHRIRFFSYGGCRYILSSKGTLTGAFLQPPGQRLTPQAVLPKVRPTGFRR